MKQHALSHVFNDIIEKGVTRNYSARPGEGMIQEVKQSYCQTNRRGADVQVSKKGQYLEIYSRGQDVYKNEECRD